MTVRGDRRGLARIRRRRRRRAAQRALLDAGRQTSAARRHDAAAMKTQENNRGEIRVGLHAALRQAVEGDEAAGRIDLGKHDGAEAGDDDGATEQPEEIQRSLTC
jgi:hypothetical protein